MVLFRLTLLPLASLALLLEFLASGQAQTAGGRRFSISPAAVPSLFPIPPQVLRTARLVPYQAILAETLADNSPGAAEVHSYLRNPAQWQKNLSQQKAYELGLPMSRLIFPDGTVLRTWLRAPIPADWRYHYFTDALQTNWTRVNIFDATHVYEIQAPPGSKILALLPAAIRGK